MCRRFYDQQVTETGKVPCSVGLGATVSDVGPDCVAIGRGFLNAFGAPVCTSATVHGSTSERIVRTSSGAGRPGGVSRYRDRRVERAGERGRLPFERSSGTVRDCQPCRRCRRSQGWRGLTVLMRLEIAYDRLSLKGRVYALAAGAGKVLTRPRVLRPFLNRGLALIGSALGRDGEARIVVDRQIEFRVPLSDSYWMAAGLNGEYEPDLFRFLCNLQLNAAFFIDCGANVGFWSLIAAKHWGWNPVAIESSSELVARIDRARADNQAEFSIMHRAIWKSDGEIMSFRTGIAHAGGHLADVKGFVDDRRIQSVEQVKTVTIDRIAAESRLKLPTIIKLDVEGAECEAIEGALETLNAGALLIYEDHGRDPECRPTKMLLDHDLSVYVLGSQIRRIASIDEARAVKQNRFEGYNFVAIRAGSPLADSLLSA